MPHPVQTTEKKERCKDIEPETKPVSKRGGKGSVKIMQCGFILTSKKIFFIYCNFYCFSFFFLPRRVKCYGTGLYITYNKPAGCGASTSRGAAAPAAHWSDRSLERPLHGQCGTARPAQRVLHRASCTARPAHCVHPVTLLSLEL